MIDEHPRRVACDLDEQHLDARLALGERGLDFALECR